MKRLSVLVFAMALIASVTVAQAGPKFSDEEVIKAIAIRFQEAWNHHDIKVLSSLVADDVDFINVAGLWLKNRREFEELHARAHQAQFKESELHFKESHIKLIGRSIALVHVEWSMKGDRNPDGTPREPRQGIFTWVVAKREGKWLIIAAHNTNLREPPGR